MNPDTLTESEFISLNSPHVLAGLLASGHFTEAAPEITVGYPTLLMEDLGSDWKEYYHTKRATYAVRYSIEATRELYLSIKGERENS